MQRLSQALGRERDLGTLTPKWYVSIKYLPHSSGNPTEMRRKGEEGVSGRGDEGTK